MLVSAPLVNIASCGWLSAWLGAGLFVVQMFLQQSTERVNSQQACLPVQLSVWLETLHVLICSVLRVCCRYVMPLLVAATFAGALTRVMALRQWSSWVTPASGVLLLVGGTYTLLSRVVPA